MYIIVDGTDGNLTYLRVYDQMLLPVELRKNTRATAEGLDWDCVVDLRKDMYGGVANCLDVTRIEKNTIHGVCGTTKWHLQAPHKIKATEVSLMNWMCDVVDEVNKLIKPYDVQVALYNFIEGSEYYSGYSSYKRQPEQKPKTLHESLTQEVINKINTIISEKDLLITQLMAENGMLAQEADVLREENVMWEHSYNERSAQVEDLTYQLEYALWLLEAREGDWKYVLGQRNSLMTQLDNKTRDWEYVRSKWFESRSTQRQTERELEQIKHVLAELKKVMG